MITVEETPRGLRAVDGAKNEVEVVIKGWRAGGDDFDIQRDTDVIISGCSKSVQLPGQAAYVESKDRHQHQVVKYPDQLRLDAGEHLIHTDDIMKIFLKTKGEFKLLCDKPYGNVEVVFPTSTQISIGVRSHIDIPTENVQIPPTLDGLAYAISLLGHSHTTDTPDRSYPSTRGYPPIIELDEEADIDSNEILNGDPSLHIVLPYSLDYIYYVAPLAYYLGSDVILENTTQPHIKLHDKKIFLSKIIRKFTFDISEILSRVFYLDCLTRNAGPYGFELTESSVLSDIPIDPNHIYNLPITDRLDAYLDIGDHFNSEMFPKWPLTISVQPSMDNIPAISHLAYCLAFLFPPEYRNFDGHTFVGHSLEKFVRAESGSTSFSSSDQPNLIEPIFRRGMLHGWMDDGLPVDGFKALPTAFLHRWKQANFNSNRRFGVVLNDLGMGSEYFQVIDEYRALINDFSLDIDLFEQVTADEMNSIVSDPYDVVHFIGHCDSDGLKCERGHFSFRQVSNINTNSIFLNACESYSEGIEFIRRGGVTSGVTIGRVLDEQAKRVGVTFAKLLGRGFSFASSVLLGRCRSIMNQNYAILGDGTNTVCQGKTNTPSALFISDEDNDSFRVWPHLISPVFHGSVLYPFPDSQPVLAGNDSARIVSKDYLCGRLEDIDQPLIFEDQFFWPEEFLSYLG